jgi:class 3 adenylate cyclase
MSRTSETANTLPTASDETYEPEQADDWTLPSLVTGTEAPAQLSGTGGPRTMMRSFAFLDMCGSTAYLEREGAQATVKAVSDFRNLAREVSARRGVRVAKWLGDGAMIVGVSVGPTVAAAVELCARMRDEPLKVRAGVAVSPALLFDGNDYLGRGANFAARLCAAADPDETLCDIDCAASIPGWIDVAGTRSVVVHGMGAHDVLIIQARNGTDLPPLC